MSALLLILLSAALVNVIAVTSAPRWRPFATTEDVYTSARALALLSALAVPVATLAGWSLSAAVLQPLDLQYLRTPAYAAIALILAWLLEGALRRDGRLLPQRPGFTLLMTSNTAVLGVALLARARAHDGIGAFALAATAAVALAVLILTLTAIHERLRAADVPRPFASTPLALMTTGLAALAFMGFTGLVQE